MNKNILGKIKFINPDDPIQIFCSQKYKDYYLRGQIIEIKDIICDETLANGYGDACYHFQIFVLINDNYLRNIEDVYYDEFGLFQARTKQEYLKIQKEDALESAKGIYKLIPNTLEECCKDILSRKNKTFEINLKELGIQEDSYLLNSIRNKKDLIVLKMEINLDRVISSENYSIIKNYPKKIYLLPTYIFHAEFYEIFHENTEGIIYKFIDHLFNNMFFNYEYDFKDKNEYYILLGKIAEICLEWLKTKTVSPSYLAKLNNFNSEIKDRSLPFYDFCGIFFDNLLDEIKEKREITQCSYCGNYFSSHNKRKYCPPTDGRDCGKSARNSRYYQKHRDKILPKAKTATKELRDFYKKRGIKK